MVKKTRHEIYVFLNVIMRPNTEARNVPVTFHYFVVTSDLQGNGRDITIVGKAKAGIVHVGPKEMERNSK
jgi:hypothetical protein